MRNNLNEKCKMGKRLKHDPESLNIHFCRKTWKEELKNKDYIAEKIVKNPAFDF